MTQFLAFTIVGIAAGSIYAVTAAGLVLTYTTSGVFNFGHGAIGMICAFSYWELRVHHHWAAPVALAVVLLVEAPALGAIIERVLMRGLAHVDIGVSLVVSLGLLLTLLGLAQTLWSNTTTRAMPQFFGNDAQVRLFSVNVTVHQLIMIAVGGAVAVVLRVLLTRTPVGIAMRGVVDDPDLMAMTGTPPERLGQISWAIGAMLAGLAGILLAPLVSLDTVLLTLLVIDGYAGAMVGRLRSLPLTFAGAMALGLFRSYSTGFLPQNVLKYVGTSLPTIFLYAVLLLLPSARLRTARIGGGRVPKVASLKTSLLAGAALLGAAWVVSGSLSVTNLATAGKGVALGLITLSLVLLTGYGGQVSLCQLTFVGFGAFAMGHIAGGSSPLGLLAAVALAAAVGAVAALPSLRLQGLYLALSTLAFAQLMTFAFFNNSAIFGNGGSLHVGRPHIFGLHFDSERSFFMLLTAAFVAAAAGVLAVRRGEFGRRLAAMRDSPAACATLGMDLTRTKLAVFAGSAGLAGLAGAFFGGLRTSVTSGDFVLLQSLALLLLAYVWGINSVVGALLAGIVSAIFPTIQQHLPHVSVLYLGAGLGAVSLGRQPAGVIGDLGARWEALRARPPRRPVPTPVPDVAVAR